NSPEDTRTGFARTLDSCRSAGFTPAVRQADTLESYMLWVEAGYGIAILSEKNSLVNNPALKFLPVEGINSSDVVLAWSMANSNPLTSFGINAISGIVKGG
ncbi:MAG: hypothetical protein HGA22_05215, partial [Clostridiales bacterium]|nr:hypothetical protein [Clostridiales bacterium]